MVTEESVVVVEEERDYDSSCGPKKVAPRHPTDPAAAN